MNYPEFFKTIQIIKLKDDLSYTLGAFDDGIIEYSYLDVVKLAGHSCPTVMGAYLECLLGLKALYKDEIPKRGEIKVEFSEDGIDGVSGVIANVISLITGATKDNGFKGLNGNFSRINLMEFNVDISSSVRFIRTDTKEFVDVTYNASNIKPYLQMNPLMQKVITKQASKDELKAFGELWQQRVYEIYKNKDSVIKIS